MLRRTLHHTLRHTQALKRSLLGDRLSLRHLPLGVPLLERLLRASALPTAHVLGHTLHLDPTDALSLSLHGIYEPELTRFLQRTLRPGDTLLDIGAHIGYYTLLFARHTGPTGTIIALEPDPATFALLSRNVSLNHYTHRTHLHQAAAAETTGHVALNASHLPGDRYLDPTAPPDTPALAPDDLVAQHLGDHPPTWIKLDIQGGELSALRGLQRTLARAHHTTVLTEFWPHGLRRSHEDPTNWSPLTQHGFTPHLLTPDATLQPTTLDHLLSTYLDTPHHTNVVWNLDSRA